jgi:signal transduction histidine kinase
MGEITPAMQQALTIINQRTQAAVRLMSDVMSLEQAEMGKLEFEPVSVAEVVGNSIGAARMAAQAQQLSIQTDVAEDLPPVYADPRRLAQVFDNLLGNAIKFSAEAGHITVRAFCKGEHVHIEVADQGIGIPAEHLSRIFDRYYQVEGARARGRGGSGLGLAIVKCIVEAHGGQVTVSSQVGMGSTFSIMIPVMSDRDHAATRHSPVGSERPAQWAEM